MFTPYFIIFILPSHLRLCLQSGLFPSEFHTKKTMHLISHACYMPLPSNPPKDIWRRVQLWSSSLCNFLHFIRR